MKNKKIGMFLSLTILTSLFLTAKPVETNAINADTDDYYCNAVEAAEKVTSAKYSPMNIEYHVGQVRDLQKMGLPFSYDENIEYPKGEKRVTTLYYGDTPVGTVNLDRTTYNRSATEIYNLLKEIEEYYGAFETAVSLVNDGNNDADPLDLKSSKAKSVTDLVLFVIDKKEKEDNNKVDFSRSICMQLKDETNEIEQALKSGGKTDILAGEYATLTTTPNGDLFVLGRYRVSGEINRTLYPKQMLSNHFIGGIKEFADTYSESYAGDHYGLINEKGYLYTITEEITDIREFVYDDFKKHKVKSASVGLKNNIVATEEGEVYVSGDNGNKLLANKSLKSSPYGVKINELSNIKKVAINNYLHDYAAYALNEDGELYTWGSSSFGMLGYSISGMYQETPKKVNFHKKIIDINVSKGTAFIIDEDNKLWTFGLATNSSLGYASKANVTVPQLVKNLETENVQAVVTYEGLHAVIANGGDLFVWGSNKEKGLLGRGHLSKTDLEVPVKLINKDLDAIKKVSISNNHVIAAGDYIWTWGDDYNRQLGLYPFKYDKKPYGKYPQNKAFPYVPTKTNLLYVKGISDIRNPISERKYERKKEINDSANLLLGKNEYLIVNKYGELYASNNNARSKYPSGLTPTKLNGINNVKRMAYTYDSSKKIAAITHSDKLIVWSNDHREFQEFNVGEIKEAKLFDLVNYIITTNGDVYAWGENQYAQFGNGVTNLSKTNTPVKSTYLKNIVQIESGYSYDYSNRFASYAVDNEGNVWAWGSPVGGQLGMKSDKYVITIPQIVEGLPKIKKVAAHYGTVVALTEEGEVYYWGSNRLINGTTSVSYSATKLEGVSSIEDIYMSKNTLIFLDKDNKKIISKGFNVNKQIIGATEKSNTFVEKVTSFDKEIKDIQVGLEETIVIDLHNNLYTWSDKTFSIEQFEEKSGYNRLSYPIDYYIYRKKPEVDVYLLMYHQEEKAIFENPNASLEQTPLYNMYGIYVDIGIMSSEDLVKIGTGVSYVKELLPVETFIDAMNAKDDVARMGYSVRFSYELISKYYRINPQEALTLGVDTYMKGEEFKESLNLPTDVSNHSLLNGDKDILNYELKEILFNNYQQLNKCSVNDDSLNNGYSSNYDCLTEGLSYITNSFAEELSKMDKQLGYEVTFKSENNTEQ